MVNRYWNAIKMINYVDLLCKFCINILKCDASPSPLSQRCNSLEISAHTCTVFLTYITSSDFLLPQAWISFAPVAYPAAEYYHTSANVINGLSIVFMVATIPFGLLAIWVLDTHGLRAAVSS